MGPCASLQGNLVTSHSPHWKTQMSAKLEIRTELLAFRNLIGKRGQESQHAVCHIKLSTSVFTQHLTPPSQERFPVCGLCSLVFSREGVSCRGGEGSVVQHCGILRSNHTLHKFSDRPLCSPPYDTPLFVVVARSQAMPGSVPGTGAFLDGASLSSSSPTFKYHPTCTHNKKNK